MPHVPITNVAVSCVCQHVFPFLPSNNIHHFFFLARIPGKAGGGGVRRRIAVGAVNFTRGAHNWAKGHLDQHSYPVMRRDGTIVDAKFCNSARFHHLRNRTISTYEGNQECTAQTPIGKMLACPEIFRKQPECAFHPNEAASAHLVYVGHNSLGNEVQWLPVPYLQDWWRRSGSSLVYGGKQKHYDSLQTEKEGRRPQWRDWMSGGLNSTGNQNQEDNQQQTEYMMMHSLLQRLDGQHPWCDDLRRPIQVPWKAGLAYQECAKTKLEGPVDAFATRLLLGGDGTIANPKKDDPVARGRAFAQIYASLPVVRVTQLREPMSWLVSRFAWHGLPNKFKITCDDIAHATGPTDKFATTGLGWVNHFSLVYIMNICGEDCMVRYLTHGNVTLTELEAQASHNLRHSLAVVGLLHETDTFYDMITARVQYMDLSDNSTEGQGQHKSAKSDYCKERFEEAAFQAKLMAASPELATLMRLYEVGVKVNAFQKQELEQCTGRKLVVS